MALIFFFGKKISIANFVCLTSTREAYRPVCLLLHFPLDPM